MADLTGTNPNVMWEVGYVMAQGCPTIIVTQQMNTVPFDLRDMQAIEYDRTRLSKTLGDPLRKIVADTVAAGGVRSDVTNEFVGQLLSELRELKGMMAGAVQAWNPKISTARSRPTAALKRLEGAWLSEESGSHVYAKVVRGQLVAPYCYGANHSLTGVYFGWKKTGDYWFARYKWLREGISGFSFLKEISANELNGAWWYGDHSLRSPTKPPPRQGEPATWRRLSRARFPSWASEFLQKIEREGLRSVLPRNANRDSASGGR